MTILALDIGSSSVRAVLFENDTSGVRLIPDAIVSRSYTFDTDEPGQATVDPVFLRELTEACIDDILQHEAAQNIQAVGMDTLAGNMVLVGYENQPLAPMQTYGDTRGAKNLEWLRRHVEPESLHQQTGVMLNTAYWPAQIPLFEYPHDAEPFVTAYLDFGSFLYRSWFQSQNVPISYSIAAWSGLLNRQDLGWHRHLLEVLTVPDMMMAPLADYSAAQQGLSGDYAGRWPQLTDVPFYLAVGDGASAQVGSGAVGADTATLSVGTTAAIRKVSTERLPTVPQGCWSYFIDRDHFLLGGALSEGGNIFAWARDVLKLDFDTLEVDLMGREPGTHGLTILPLLSGERSPGWRGDATGTIHGIRLSTTALDMLHAALESVALRLAMIAGQLGLSDATKIMASGGALSASPAWAQIIADALQRPLYLLDEPEITALGTAHLAHCALNGKPLTGASPKIAAIIEPRRQFAATIATMLEQQKALYDGLYR